MLTRLGIIHANVMMDTMMSKSSSWKEDSNKGPLVPHQWHTGTSGTGKSVLCGVIFAAETLSVEGILEIDIFAKCKDDIFSNENYGPGKYFPDGPKCNFRGQKITCRITCSPKGSITSSILADMLKWIDNLGVFSSVPGGHTPFLLLDGHGSRLEVPFQKYINDVNHKWVVYIVVPNNTSIWQVGDSNNEQNGYYEMYCSGYKKDDYE